MPNPTLHSSALTAQLVLCAVAVVSLLYIPLQILPALADTYGLSPAISAYAVGAFSLAYALGFLVFGPLSDRLGRSRVMVSGLVALSAISIGLATVQSPVLFLAGRFAQGFAAASFAPVALAYLAERGTPGQRTWSIAWMSTAFLSAGLLGQMYGTQVAARWGFGVALVPLAILYALTALRVAIAPAGTPASRHASPLWDVYRPMGSLLRNPQLLRVYVPALVLLMCFIAFYIGMDAKIGQALAKVGVSPFAGRALALPAFLAPLAVAGLIGRRGPTSVARLGLAVTTLGLVLAALAGSAHLYVFLAASVLFVAGIGISVPALIAQVASLAAPHERGLAVALYTFLLFIGASAGPWLAQSTVALSASSFFALLACLMGAAALFSSVPAKQRAAYPDPFARSHP